MLLVVLSPFVMLGAFSHFFFLKPVCPYTHGLLSHHTGLAGAKGKVNTQVMSSKTSAWSVTFLGDQLGCPVLCPLQYPVQNQRSPSPGADVTGFPESSGITVSSCDSDAFL